MESSNPDRLQSLGVFGIYKESYKIIASWKKIFFQLTLALILPLSIIYLSEIQISHFINTKINHNTQVSSLNVHTSRTSSQWTTFGIITAIYLILLLIFTLLSTSTVVYTVASIYTHKEISFKSVMKVVPQVWIRLIFTFICFFISVIIYIIIAAVVLHFLALITNLLIIAVIVGFLCLIGLIYICIIWNLACVVSVLEKRCVFNAVKASTNLIKGKIWVSSVIFVAIYVLELLVVFGIVVVNGESMKLVGKVFLGIFCYLFLGVLILMSLVTQTVIYFVCKSYHQESIIDRSGLAQHVELSYARMGGV